MKKGLLSILAGALLVVGCQNYDDQFDSLETQINALASTVAGLTQVQSDLASLAGTVSSLSSTVASLGSTIDTAVANGLADITADITALQAAVADVASSSDVTAISDAVAAAQTDLDELLANSSVFTGNIEINSVATLDAFHAMGSSLNIVNGNVTFNVSTDMDATKVQTVVDNILTITKDLSYTGASATTVPTFKNLTGVQSLTMSAPGDYRFDNLVTATKVVLNNNNASKIGIVHFGKLVNATHLSDDGGVSGVLAFSNATEFHLSSMERVPGNKLNVTLKKGSVLDIPSLSGLDSDGKVVAMDIDVSGPASFTSTKIADGNINLSNVAKVDISGFYGAIVIGTGVNELTTSKAVSLSIAAADDLQTANIDVALDWDPKLTTAPKATTAPAVTFASQDLTTASITGVAGTITVDGQNNLTSLTVKSTGKGDLVVQNNTDLETLVVTGSTLNDITVNANNNLTSLVLDHTTGFLATDDLGATVKIQNNTDLESLTFSADSVNSLTVTGNVDMTKVNFTGLAKIGEKTASVNITGNKLSASKAVDTYQDADGDGNAEAGDGQGLEEGTKTDKGKYTTNSGMETLKTYLTAAVAAPSSSGVIVAFDAIDVTVDEALLSANNVENSSVTVTQSSANAGADWYVAYVTPSTSSGRSTKQATTFAIPVKRDANGDDTLLSTDTTKDNITIVNGNGGTKTFGPTTAITTVDQLVAAINGDTTVAGITVEADRDAFHEQLITITYASSDGLAETTSATNGKIYFTYGKDPETGKAIGVQTADVAAVNASGIATAIATALNGATNAYQATATSGVIRITALVSGTTEEDRGPIPHPFQTLSILAGSASTTKLLSGDNANVVVSATAASNTLAIASKMFSLTTAAASHSGVRVTLKNNSTVISLPSMAVTAGATSVAFAGNDAGEPHAVVIAAGTNMVGSGISSSSLDYVATFAQIESVVVADGEDTDRTSWL